jgi:hypothetical protein
VPGRAGSRPLTAAQAGRVRGTIRWLPASLPSGAAPGSEAKPDAVTADTGDPGRTSAAPATPQDEIASSGSQGAAQPGSYHDAASPDGGVALAASLRASRRSTAGQAVRGQREPEHLADGRRRLAEHLPGRRGHDCRR